MSEWNLADYGALVAQLTDRVIATNGPAIGEAAQLVVDVARSGQIVHAAGAGHSLAGVLEMFFRAGGLPFVYPLWHPDILPLNGALRSTAAERRPGLGTEVARGSGMREGDAVFVFSTSGINPYPVEVAAHARSVGARVVAVTSMAASAVAPLRADRRLAEVADIVLDTCVPPGDVMWPVDAPRSAPLSSTANVLCWNLILVAALDLAPDLPTWHSANTSDNADHNERLQARYAALVPTI